MSRPSSTKTVRPNAIGVKLPHLDSDLVADMGLFADAASLKELDSRLRSEVANAVQQILELTNDCDAFDVIELMRLRELPISPVLALDPDYDGSAAAIELVALVLLTRGRQPINDVPREDSRPHEVIDALHRIAKRLSQLATFWAQWTARVRGGGALARLAADYQSYFAGVRGMQYDSIQDAHDRALLDRPEIERVLRDQLGFSYSTFRSVRSAISDIYTERMNNLRDVTARIATLADSEHRDPTPEEISTFRQSMVDMMFLPGTRASFTVADVADVADVDRSTVEAVLGAFSTHFDARADPTEVVMAFLRGRNPPGNDRSCS